MSDTANDTAITPAIQWSNRSLWRLTWPLMVELLLAVAIGMADTIMVTTVGESAVSGISLVDSVNFLFITLISALATGGSVVISQYLGRREGPNAAVAAKQVLYSTTVVTIILMVITLIFRRGILSFIYGSLEPDVMQAAETYFLLSAISYPFLGVYNAGAAIFRSMGNSRVSMFISIAMNVTNIGGNAILIFGAGWGVAGAGTASLFSRIVAAVIIVLLLNRTRGALEIRDMLKIHFNWPMIKSILRVGIPNGLENSVFQIGKLLTASIISTFGTAAIAANAIAGNLLAFGNVPGQAVGFALLTVIGQTIGGRDVPQARRLCRKLMLVAHATMAVVSLALYLVIDPMLGLFNLSAEGTEIARQCSIVYFITMPFFWPQSFALPNALRAAGDARYTMVVSILSMWVFRIGCSYLLAYGLNMGVLGVWYAMVVDWLFRGAFFLLRWRGKKWESKKVLD